jgi:hypothetical protein
VCVKRMRVGGRSTQCHLTAFQRLCVPNSNTVGEAFDRQCECNDDEQLHTATARRNHLDCLALEHQLLPLREHLRTLCCEEEEGEGEGECGTSNRFY